MNKRLIRQGRIQGYGKRRGTYRATGKREGHTGLRKEKRDIQGYEREEGHTGLRKEKRETRGENTRRRQNSGAENTDPDDVHTCAKVHAHFVHLGFSAT